MTSDRSFVGRRKEIEKLHQAYAERRHVLIAGPAGIGKTALLRRAQNQLPLLVCEETSSLRRICESLERHFGWTHRNMNVVERKNRLLPYLSHRREPVALDAVALTSPRVAHFIHNLIERVPVWITCRSSQPKDIGAVWQHLHHFERIELPALPLHDMADLIQSAIAAGRIAPLTPRQIAKLHRIARGNPRAVEELLIELSSRRYDLDDAFETKLLNLDRRIHYAAAMAAAQNCVES